MTTYLQFMLHGGGNRFLSQGALTAFAGDMHQEGLIDNLRYREFIQAIDAGIIAANVDVLHYFDRALVFDCRELPESPEQYYGIIYDRIRSIVPGFDPTGLTVRQQIREGHGETIAHELVISMWIDGRSYTQSVFYAPEWKESLDYLGMVANDFQGIVNNWLTETGGEYRLHFVGCAVSHNEAPVTRYDRFGVIALRKEEYRLFDRYHASVLQPHAESFCNIQVEGRIERMIVAYKSIGLFSHLSSEQVDAATNRAMTMNPDDINDVIECFPRMFVDIHDEAADLDHVYVHLTEDLAAVSRGAFAPSDVRDDYVYGESEQVAYSFQFNGKRYEATLFAENDWLDSSFLTLIDRAIAENIPDGRFHNIYGGDIRQMFLTTEQYRYLRDRRLLHFFPESADDWNRLDEWKL